MSVIFSASILSTATEDSARGYETESKGCLIITRNCLTVALKSLITATLKNTTVNHAVRLGIKGSVTVGRMCFSRGSIVGATTAFNHTEASEDHKGEDNESNAAKKGEGDCRFISPTLS